MYGNETKTKTNRPKRMFRIAYLATYACKRNQISRVVQKIVFEFAYGVKRKSTIARKQSWSRVSTKVIFIKGF